MSAFTIHRCPICDWAHSEPMNDVPADALAGVFGMGVMANISINRRNERIEEALSGHLKSHPVLDWVKKVTSLQAQVEKLQRDRESLAGFAREVAKRFDPKPKCDLCDDTGSMSDGTACPHLTEQSRAGGETHGS